METLVCKTCGKPYEATPQMVKKNSKYCSSECKSNAHGVVVTCAQCGKSIRRPKSWTASGMKRKQANDYCSRKCYDAYRMKPVSVICEVCGAEFEVWQSRFARGATKYCSKECRHIGVGQRNKLPDLTKTCEICGTEFVLDRSYKDQRFCSSACYGTWRAKTGIASGENNPGYVDGSTDRTFKRLRNREWKKLANSVREQRGNKCEVCNKVGTARKFPVHHKIPWEISKDDSEENLLVVCQSCHAKLDRAYYKLGLVPY